MPTVTEQDKTGYAFCSQARCPGNSQQKVPAVYRVTERTYREMGGDSPGIEASWQTVLFKNEDDANCAHCGRRREITDQPRVTYENLSGQNPMGLLGAPQFDPKKQAELQASPVTNAEREQFQAQIDALSEQVKALVAATKE